METTKSYIGDGLFDSLHHVAHVPQVIDSFLSEVIKIDNEDVTFVSSDVKLLFDSESIKNKLGSDSFNTWLQNLRHSNTTSDFSGFSDDELLQFVKGRHVQELSEVNNWSEFLNSRYKSLDDSVKQYQYWKSQQKVKQTSIDESKSD